MYFYTIAFILFSITDALSNLKIKSLNAMQEASLQANASNNDVVLLADTGSGKTLAFLLPVAQLLNNTKPVCQALIVVSSRELALQIEKVFKTMSTGFKITCCYGGHLRETEENNLSQAPSLIVGTPGRLADHIRRGNIVTTHIETLVLDEFDKSLEQGFEAEMSFIIQSLTKLKKRILTSATEAVEIPAFVGLKNPIEINFLTGKKSEALAVQMVRSNDADKSQTLFNLICKLGNRSTIVFCNQREFVEQVSHFLKDKGIVNVFYHGAMEQQERDVALCKFRNGSSNVLVTTDLAARVSTFQTSVILSIFSCLLARNLIFIATAVLLEWKPVEQLFYCLLHTKQFHHTLSQLQRKLNCLVHFLCLKNQDGQLSMLVQERRTK